MKYSGMRYSRDDEFYHNSIKNIESNATDRNQYIDFFYNLDFEWILGNLILDIPLEERMDMVKGLEIYFNTVPEISFSYGVLNKNSLIDIILSDEIKCNYDTYWNSDKPISFMRKYSIKKLESKENKTVFVLCQKPQDFVLASDEDIKLYLRNSYRANHPTYGEYGILPPFEMLKDLFTGNVTDSGGISWFHFDRGRFDSIIKYGIENGDDKAITVNQFLYSDDTVMYFTYLTEQRKENNLSVKKTETVFQKFLSDYYDSIVEAVNLDRSVGK